jgi:hypothetical protein
MRFKGYCIAIMAVSSTIVMAQQTLNDDSIIKMHAAGLADDLVVSVINSQAQSTSQLAAPIGRMPLDGPEKPPSVLAIDE